LEPEGLYLTHLFREVDVILRPDWFTGGRKSTLTWRSCRCSDLPRSTLS
jgi:hypothetical protein